MSDSEWHARFASPPGTVFEPDPVEDLSTCPWCKRPLRPHEYIRLTDGHGWWHYDCDDPTKPPPAGVLIPDPDEPVR